MKNKVIIITGASSGIGKACAEKFGAMGAKVVLAARNINNLNEAATQLQKLNIDLLAVQCDVSKKEDCEKLINETVSKYGKVDVLINNAGISMRALFNDTDLSVIERVMNINFWGTVYCTKYALPYLLQSKGSVVGVSSIAGYLGLPARTGYSASKYAMQGFLDALRTENLKTGLHVMVACPGFTASNIRNTALSSDGSAQGESPRKEEKMMTAEEVANYIYKGVSSRKRTLVLTTEGKLAVFLGKLFPKFIEKQVFNKMAKEPDSPIK
ncbi:SDR family oxidoreductase [Vicingus serpentipes]|jgi:dehydrogenase/reductase SDR family member 7B|uniref:SDR family oxidoreductase n=1 Tax=Vicingus serpentipes TaxID=1926625 RepID=A0A5C6S053_9FLAO|nr:SDR family oxidoreductase [Vicingus serpentipes]TXB66992.1 SDR family oxidoreductase [Vicingus serpentipes]